MYMYGIVSYFIRGVFALIIILYALCECIRCIIWSTIQSYYTVNLNINLFYYKYITTIGYEYILVR